ncbi:MULTISPECIES: helix-turn-helix domain-containing protein [unclassified Microcoleus]|uniref:helix-turn-helix domain-containing protein n=1 Tax=unclassified Microcoleus TaxID=2642155 RepID=UPI002FD28E61
MKVNYQERIDLTADELKIILSQQRTLPNKQKIQALYWLKTGASQSLTDVAERLGVHRITVHRWLTQYTAGGMPELLKIRQATGRPRVIPSAVIAGLSEKLSEESCDFKTYKEIGQWVEENYQISVKYQTLHKQVHYRMKANLKEAKPVINEKAQEAGIDFKKSKKLLKND